MAGSTFSKRSAVRGNFVGAVLENDSLPTKGHGSVPLYQIGEHDTRILMDVKNPLPF